ncbi:hypothetical protein BX600DRAFT_514140 [Xylariales sp. PMI_506]|nr:hypothetical protein BX600DRAFT_514140 [Xylariales sp. PMI_506]
MATEAPSTHTPFKRPTYSCIRCAERKVRCDRNTPCGACIRHNVDCVFNPSQPPRNRHRRAKGQILADRVRHYESILREKGIDPSKFPTIPDSEPHGIARDATQRVQDKTHLHSAPLASPERRRPASKYSGAQGQERFKFVENVLWSRMVEELHDPLDGLDDSDNDATDAEDSDDELGLILRSQPKNIPRSRHPSPGDILQLWQIFVNNIDPLVKILHVPTVRSVIEKASDNIDDIPRSCEALMFAIYSAAVMSLSDDECKQQLHEPRKLLLSRYVSATKAALSRARFMATTSLAVLQALILHILSVRDIYEPRAVWTLTGVAARIAQGMGLERDGVYLGLPPFETEMRRRVWWQLKIHDFRTAELCGIDKYRDLHTGAKSTKWPTNVNDDQLYPGMPSLPPESTKLTDIVFVALKCELLRFAADRLANFRSQANTSENWELQTTEDGLLKLEELLETKYLRYCDPSQPLHLMSMLMARCSINVIRFLSHHPRRWSSIEKTPLAERQLIWDVSIKLLEQHSMLQSNPQLRQYAWHGQYFQQWHAIIHVLDALRARPCIADAEKAWKLISNIYVINKEMIFDMRKPIHVAVGNLCLKSYAARDVASKSRNAPLLQTPNFIMQLRQQREALMARTQARQSKINKPEEKLSDGQENTVLNAQLLESRIPNNLTNTSEFSHLQFSTLLHPQIPNLGQPGYTTTASTSPGDLFWSTHGFSDGESGDRNDIMSIDLDLMLDQDYSLDGIEDAGYTFTWDQWDSWLADSNVIRPLSSDEHGG